MFSTGAYLKIWSVVDKGNFTEVDCSTSVKNKQTGDYETDFSHKFVRFVSNAHKKRPQADEKVKVTNCGVQNVYMQNGKKQYLKTPIYLVFDFEREASATAQSGYGYVPSAYADVNANFEEIPLADNGDLPF